MSIMDFPLISPLEFGLLILSQTAELPTSYCVLQFVWASFLKARHSGARVWKDEVEEATL